MIARPPLVVPFTKMNGAGNDFVVLDNRFLRFSDDELEALARQACPRRTGVGADGLLALDDDGGADFRMRYRNADGSLGTMCGNGARCLARFAARAGLGLEAPDGTVALEFETDGGRYRAVVEGRGASGPVTLDVPPPRDFGPAGLEAAGGPVLRVWTGTEHAVVFAPDVEAAALGEFGPRVRHDPAFAPTGTNVNVVEVVEVGPRARVRARTFEKGVEAETLACGTGALASAIAARLDGRVGEAEDQAVSVEMPGGTLEVSFRVRDGAVEALTLAGPAETVYEGTLEWAV